jgi:hypothetical protein
MKYAGVPPPVPGKENEVPVCEAPSWVQPPSSGAFTSVLRKRPTVALALLVPVTVKFPLPSGPERPVMVKVMGGADASLIWKPYGPM